MAAYIFLFAGTFAVFLVYYIYRERSGFTIPRKNYETIFFFAFFILLVAFRGDTVGADTDRYIYLFNHIKSESLGQVITTTNVEQGFRILEKLLSIVIKNPHFYLAVIALITLIPIGMLYYHESELPLLALAMFMAFPTSHMAFSGLRQMMSIALIVPAFYLVRNKRLIPFLLVVLAAYFFHQSAIIILLLYPVYHLPLKTVSFAVVLPTIAFVFLYNNVVFTWLIRFLPEQLIEKKDQIVDTGGTSVLVLMVFLVVLSFFMIRKSNMDKETSGLRNILVLSAILQCFAPINTLAMRLNYYFILFVPLAVARILNRCDEDKKKIAVVMNIALTVFFTATFFYKAAIGNDGFQMFPYKSCSDWLNQFI